MSEPSAEEKQTRAVLGHFVGLAGEANITLETTCPKAGIAKAGITISASMLRILLASYDGAVAQSKWRGAVTAMTFRPPDRMQRYVHAGHQIDCPQCGLPAHPETAHDPCDDDPETAYVRIRCQPCKIETGWHPLDIPYGVSTFVFVLHDDNGALREWERLREMRDLKETVKSLRGRLRAAEDALAGRDDRRLSTYWAKYLPVMPAA